jgi:hypothetical protein
MHTMFQKTRIQDVLLGPLEGWHACAGEGAYCVHEKGVAAE